MKSKLINTVNQELKDNNKKRKMCENCEKKKAVSYRKLYGIYPEDKNDGSIKVCEDCKKLKLCVLCEQTLIKEGDICYPCWDHNEEIVEEQGLKYVE